MIEINFIHDSYNFSSIGKNDLEDIGEWVIKNDGEISSYSLVDLQILYRRFLEYYITEDEVYIKIVNENDNNIVGIFKGRFEKKNEFFVWLFIIDEKLRNRGLGSEFLEVIIKYFSKDKEIKNIRVGIAKSNVEALSFWKSCKFEIERISKDFFERSNLEHEDMIIMKR